MFEHADGSFTLAATGDSIITRPVLAQADRSKRLRDLVETLQTADATTTNLEVVLTDDETYATPPRMVSDQYQYLGSFPGMVIRSPPRILDELTAMGVDLFSAASNHSYDFGRVGMASTMAAFRDRDLGFAGLGRSLPDSRAPAYVTTPGGRVGMVAASTSIAPGSEAGDPSPRLPGRPGISPLHVNWTYNVTEERLAALREIAQATGIEAVRDTWLSREGGEPDEGYSFMHMRFQAVDDEGDEGIEYSLHDPDRTAVLQQVREARTVADWVIVAVHSHQGPGGVRNIVETPSFLVEFAHRCIEAGADAFVGTGPHVLRGLEIYQEKPIFYSLGNFFCQFETQDRLPAQSFDYYDVDVQSPSGVFDARYYTDGEPSGNLAYPAYWQTVVPTCTFDSNGDLEQIELLPCSLGRERPRSRRGTPLVAKGEPAHRILDSFETLSEPFGTTMTRSDGRGFVHPE